MPRSARSWAREPRMIYGHWGLEISGSGNRDFINFNIDLDTDTDIDIDICTDIDTDFDLKTDISSWHFLIVICMQTLTA
jgi:hypothetical protein